MNTQPDERKNSLLRALLGGRTESEVIDLGGVKVKLRILPSGVKDDCRMEAARSSRKHDISDADRSGFIAADTLYRMMAKAIIDPEDGEPIGNYEAIRSYISSPYLTLLAQEYQRLEAHIAPRSAVDIDALYEEVLQYVGESDEALADFLRTHDYSTLLNFGIFMATRPTS